jgi:hypothetical protein
VTREIISGAKEGEGLSMLKGPLDNAGPLRSQVLSLFQDMFYFDHCVCLIDGGRMILKQSV